MSYLLLITYCLLVFVAIVFFISGLDDFFVDLYYLFRALYRRLFVLPKYSPLTEKQLLDQEEKPIAIMIPAWDESPVIRRMLENNLRNVNYSRYHIFVGTYPNDLETQHEVEIVRESYDNVQRIVCPKNGPTNKADCLNWIYQGILSFEKANNIQFEIFCMADSEDVVHPLSLKLFNYLIPRKDMVQIPVIPLVRSWNNFTGGHYADEFAEFHSKDIVVRERLTGVVPSAGVGCAFSRRTFSLMAQDNDNFAFNVNSLTEDYEFGLRMGRYGLKQIFAKQVIIRRSVERKSRWTGRVRQKTIRDYVAILEYFPDRFLQAVRQKSRWILGINLQGWESLGWPGPLMRNYGLARDRKAVFSNTAIFLGYLVFLIMIFIWVMRELFPDSYHYPPLVEKDTWLWYLILVDTFFLLLRFVQRAIWVRWVYNGKEALLSAPRLLWGNIINVTATARALFLWTRSKFTGSSIQWDKTAHVYPSEEVMKNYHRKLGDLLLANRSVTVSQLSRALDIQKENPQPLGAILLENGWISEEHLVEALGLQLQMRTRKVDPSAVSRNVIDLVSRDTAAEYGVFPLEINSEGKLVLAAENAITADRLMELKKLLGQPLEICLSSHSDIASAIQSTYGSTYRRKTN